jgi:hypothetical protein
MTADPDALRVLRPWLRHRFGNDLTVVLATLELAELDQPGDLAAELAAAVAAARRMAAALGGLPEG